jgi:hypothetical protein
MTRRRVATIALAVGIALAAAAEAMAPLATPPLYDGVIVAQPYIWVDPPPGHPGDPQGASAHLPMTGHKNPVVALATPEQPPQAQVVANEGDLVLPPSATSLDVSIIPLAPSVDASAASTATVLGNVYRFTVVDQNGVPATAPTSAYVSITLRAPEDAPGAQVGQLVDGAWRPLKSEVGFTATYLAVVTAFGDFAVIVPGATPSPPSGSSPTSGSSGPSSQPPSPAVSTSSTPASTRVSPASSGADGSGGARGSPPDQPFVVVYYVLILGIVVAGVVAWRRGNTTR